jgi:hypothetical protein
VSVSKDLNNDATQGSLETLQLSGAVFSILFHNAAGLLGRLCRRYAGIFNLRKSVDGTRSGLRNIRLIPSTSSTSG